MRQSHSQKHTGIALVEAIVAIGIASVTFAAVFSAAVIFLKAGFLSSDRVQATYLLSEGVEGIRFLRDQGYASNITPRIGSTFYLAPTTGGLVATSTNTLIFGQFTRTAELEEVYRRTSDDDIVPSTSSDPKSIDPGTTFLTVTVSWSGGSVSGETYIADLYGN